MRLSLDAGLVEDPLEMRLHRCLRDAELFGGALIMAGIGVLKAAS